MPPCTEGVDTYHARPHWSQSCWYGTAIIHSLCIFMVRLSVGFWGRRAPPDPTDTLSSVSCQQQWIAPGPPLHLQHHKHPTFILYSCFPLSLLFSTCVGCWGEHPQAGHWTGYDPRKAQVSERKKGLNLSKCLLTNVSSYFWWKYGEKKYHRWKPQICKDSCQLPIAFEIGHFEVPFSIRYRE